MSENLTVTAPDLARIRKESGDATMNGINTLWQVTNAIDASARRGIRGATNAFQPAVLQVAPTTAQNDVNLNGCSVYYSVSASAYNLSGFIAPESGKSMIVVVHNAGAGTLTLKHLSGSIAQNQLSLKSGADTALVTGASAIFCYLGALYRQIV